MRKFVLCVAGLCLLAGSIALPAQGSLDLSGIWKLDPSKSDPPQMMGRGGPGGRGAMRGGPPPDGARRGGGMRGGMGMGPNANLTLNIQQTAGSLIVNRQTGIGDGVRSVEQHFTLSGKECTNPGPMGNGQLISTAFLTGSTVVIQNRENMPGREGQPALTMKEEFSLADNGQTLIITTTRTNPGGEQSFKQVFVKQ